MKIHQKNIAQENTLLKENLKNYQENQKKRDDLISNL